MKIGDVELPIVSEIEQRNQAEVDEIKDSFKSIDSTAVKHSSDVSDLVITAFVNSEVHSKNYSLSKQKEEIKTLRKTTIPENSLNYRSYKGHLLVENISFIDSSDSRIINTVEIEARYFPWPKYYPDMEPLSSGQYGFGIYGNGTYLG